jgi:hypothetical protein
MYIWSARCRFALYRLLARCHAARRTSTDETTLWASALGSNAAQRLIQPAEIRLRRGGAMRTRALLAAPTIALAVAATTPATAGEERAVRSRGRQFIDKNFNAARIVCGTGPGRREQTHRSSFRPPMISPDGSHVVVDRWQAACLLEQHPGGCHALTNADVARHVHCGSHTGPSRRSSERSAREGGCGHRLECECRQGRAGRLPSAHEQPAP